MMRMVGAIVLLVSVAGQTSVARAEMTVSSPVEALHQGVSTYLRGQYEIAVPALEAATQARRDNPELRSKLFFAPFYLARIYSGMHPAYINHARAHELYLGIVNRHAFNGPEHVDLNNHRHAPAVGKAMTEVAKYLLRGIPEAGVAANEQMAISYLTHAADVYGEENAQFELAKLDLRAGSRGRTRTALYRLWRLARVCHSGALITLAEMIMKKQHSDYLVGNHAEALALATQARKCAPEHERLWIEGVYQNIYCNSDQSDRARASTVMGFSARFGEDRQTGGVRTGLEGLGMPSRVCPNGDQVPTLQEITEREGYVRGSSGRPPGHSNSPDNLIDGIIISNERPPGITADSGRAASPSVNRPMIGSLFSLGFAGRSESSSESRSRAGSRRDGIEPAGLSLITPPPAH